LGLIPYIMEHGAGIGFVLCFFGEVFLNVKLTLRILFHFFFFYFSGQNQTIYNLNKFYDENNRITFRYQITNYYKTQSIMIKKNYLFRLGLAAALLGASVMYGSCGSKDDPKPNEQEQKDPENNQNNGNDDKPVDGNTLTFDGNGSWLGAVPAAIVYKDNITLPDAGTMLRPGYNFLGWSKTADSKAPDYKAGDTFAGGDETLYAVWKIYQFAITYHIDENDLSKTVVELYAGNVLDKKDCFFRGYASSDKEGYYLNGWKDANDTFYLAGSLISVFQDCDLYPVYEKRQGNGTSMEDASIEFFN